MIAFNPMEVVHAMGFVKMGGADFLCDKPTAEVKKQRDLARVQP